MGHNSIPPSRILPWDPEETWGANSSMQSFGRVWNIVWMRHQGIKGVWGLQRCQKNFFPPCFQCLLHPASQTRLPPPTVPPLGTQTCSGWTQIWRKRRTWRNQVGGEWTDCGPTTPQLKEATGMARPEAKGGGGVEVERGRRRRMEMEGGERQEERGGRKRGLWEGPFEFSEDVAKSKSMNLPFLPGIYHIQILKKQKVVCRAWWVVVGGVSAGIHCSWISELTWVWFVARRGV